MRVLEIRPDMELDIFECSGNISEQNNRIRESIGGWFEIIRSENGKWAMLVDDMGLYKSAPINMLASILYGNYPIKGTVCIVGLQDIFEDGEDFCSVPPEVYLRIQSAVVSLRRAML